jgi:FtsH-binding integral membrane protein
LTYTFLLVIYFQGSGFLEDDAPATYSRKVEENTGLAVALCYLVFHIVKNMICTQFKHRWLALIFVWVLFGGYVGVLYYPMRFERAHFFYSTNAFVASFLLTLLLRWERKIGIVETLVQIILFVFLVVAYFSLKKWMGLAEFLYIITTVGLWDACAQKPVSWWEMFLD